MTVTLQSYPVLRSNVLLSHQIEMNRRNLDRRFDVDKQSSRKQDFAHKPLSRTRDAGRERMKLIREEDSVPVTKVAADGRRIYSLRWYNLMVLP